MNGWWRRWWRWWRRRRLGAAVAQGLSGCVKWGVRLGDCEETHENNLYSA